MTFELGRRGPPRGHGALPHEELTAWRYIAQPPLLPPGQDICASGSRWTRSRKEFGGTPFFAYHRRLLTARAVKLRDVPRPAIDLG